MIVMEFCLDLYPWVYVAFLQTGISNIIAITQHTTVLCMGKGGEPVENWQMDWQDAKSMEKAKNDHAEEHLEKDLKDLWFG